MGYPAPLPVLDPPLTDEQRKVEEELDNCLGGELAKCDGCGNPLTSQDWSRMVWV